MPHGPFGVVGVVEAGPEEAFADRRLAQQVALTALPVASAPAAAAGAVLISLYIMWSWAIITKEQLDKLVGHSAPEEFLEEVGEMAANHHEGMEVDVVRAYHFGERYTVEVEVILPGDMTVRSSHDIALDLQHKVNPPSAPPPPPPLDGFCDALLLGFPG